MCDLDPLEFDDGAEISERQQSPRSRFQIHPSERPIESWLGILIQRDLDLHQAPAAAHAATRAIRAAFSSPNTWKPRTLLKIPSPTVFTSCRGNARCTASLYSLAPPPET